MHSASDLWKFTQVFTGKIVRCTLIVQCKSMREQSLKAVFLDYHLSISNNGSNFKTKLVNYSTRKDQIQPIQYFQVGKN